MKRRNTILALWVVLLLVAITILLHGPKLQSDLTQFIPGQPGERPDFLLDALQDAPSSRVILLDLSGAPEQKLAETATQLNSALKTTSHFTHVLGVDNSLSEHEQSLLFTYRYLLNESQLDTVELQTALQQRIREISLGLPLDHQQLRRDPTSVHHSTLSRFSKKNGPDSHLGVWFSGDRQHALLLLYTDASAFDLDRQQAAIKAIYSCFDNIGSNDVELTLSGPPVFAVESRDRIKSQSQLLSILASIGVIALVFFAYRSYSATLLIALPLFSGIVVGAASVVVLFGQLHGISLAFGITLIGLTVDYPIHLFSHGGDHRAARRIWPTLRLGMITSAVGFSALLLSDFQGLAQMGSFAITGIIAASLVTRWILPTLQQEPYQTHPTLLSLTQPVTAFRKLKYNYWLLPLVFTFSCSYLLLNNSTIWENDLKRLSPIPASQLQLDSQIRQRFNAAEPGELLLLEHHSLEGLLQLSEAITAQLKDAIDNGQLESFDSPSNYLPSIKRQIENRHSLPEHERLQNNLKTALQTTPFRHNLFTSFIEDVDQSRELNPLTNMDLKGTITGLRLNSLLRQHDDNWYALVTLGKMHDRSFISTITEHPHTYYLNTSQQAAKLVQLYRDDALDLMAFGGIAILLMLSVALTNLQRLLLVSVPVITAITLTTTILVLLGERLSLFHLASLLLVLGIGLDYGLFLDRCRRITHECNKVVASLLICSTSTLLVFGLLALSPLPVLHAIGLTVSLGVLSTLVLTLSSGEVKSETIV